MEKRRLVMGNGSVSFIAARRPIAVYGVLSVLLLFPHPGLAEDWLQWGGPNGDFTANAQGLAETWPVEGPSQLWKRPLGDGYSSILCKGGQLFTMYRDGDTGVMVSLDARTGGTNWEHRYSRKIWPEMSLDFGKGPNATPLIIGDKIVGVGIDGHVRCLDLASGKLLWEHHLPTEFGRRKRQEEYGYSASPLQYKNTIIVQVGGDETGVIALRPEDGSIVWKSDPGGVSYAQATITKFTGQDQYIFYSPEEVIGLDPATGRRLWGFVLPVINGNHLTPVVKCDDSHLWVPTQFAAGGGRLVEVARAGDALDAKQVWFNAKLRASCWTQVRLDDYIYGSAGGHDTSFLTAFNWRTGEVKWRRRGFHMAQSLYADGKLIFLDQDGKLTMAKVSPDKLEVLTTVQLTEPVSWTLPTLVSTKLYVRDRKHILALDLSREANTEASRKGGTE